MTPNTSGLAKQWFKDDGIDVLLWPPQSPDLNPIEHLWSYVKRKLEEYNSLPGGVVELWERTVVEWNKIPQGVCQDLIRSMPERVEAILEAHRGYTKY